MLPAAQPSGMIVSSAIAGAGQAAPTINMMKKMQGPLMRPIPPQDRRDSVLVLDRLPDQPIRHAPPEARCSERGRRRAIEGRAGTPCGRTGIVADPNRRKISDGRRALDSGR